jgi:anti-anti-sigma factor
VGRARWPRFLAGGCGRGRPPARQVVPSEAQQTSLRVESARERCDSKRVHGRSAVSKPVGELQQHRDVHVLAVTEEIDIANADAFEEAAGAALRSNPKLVISLENCHYIDSSGLRVLIRLSNRTDIHFAVVVPPGTQTRRIFDLAGLEEQMPLFDTLEDALAKYASEATLPY